MTAPLAQLHSTTDLVAVAWVRTVPGLTADGVATQLPSDETKWAANGFVVIPVQVGGTPHENMPVRRPVCQVETWCTVPGSDKIPWGIASQLMEQIRMAALDRFTFSRPLAITANGVQYPAARVLAAKLMTEPARIWSDAGDYGGYRADLMLHWVGAGEVIP